jgi:hypothetical protein
MKVICVGSELLSTCSPSRIVYSTVVLWFGLVAALAQDAGTPRFEDYPTKAVFTGTPAAPILVSADQRMYRTRIRNGVSTGSDVWIGSYKNPIKAKGPNFAGHFFVIRWGCGSQCMMMATVDAETGKVYEPPLADQNSLLVPLDNLSDMETDLRPDSSLLILRNACRNFKDRKTCGTYYFNWRDNHFDLVKFVVVQ